MNTLSILDEVVNIFESDVNAQRITRLILFACKEIWENDPSVLERTNLREIIRNLCSKYNQIEDIEAVLNSIVSKVNKKTEYTLTANTIITQIRRLYEEEDTEVETTISNSYALQVPTYFVEPLNYSQTPEPQPEPESRSNIGYLFDIRQKIIQQTNPLRAKILIFSTVYHEFSFSNDRDWSLLKTQELDNLLRLLFEACPTLKELESRLYKTASNLDNSDDNIQSARVIIQAMADCYEQETNNHLGQIINNQNDQEDYDQTHLMNNAYHENTVTNHQDDCFNPGEITMIGKAGAANFYYHPQANNLWPNHTVFAPGDENTQTSDPDATCELSPQMQKYYVSQEIESPEDAARSTPPINISYSIKQKLELEAEIKTLVIESGNTVINTVERTLSDLEFSLDKKVISENLEEQLSRKYKALRDFIGNVEGFTAKLITMLNQLEIEERQRLNLQTETVNPANTSPETNSPTHGKINQQRLMELAKQGNPKAIAVFLNQFLQPKGITAMTLLREGCFHIVLDSSEVPEQQKIANFVQKKLETLKSKSITYVKLHGRLAGNKSVNWTQEIINLKH